MKKLSKEEIYPGPYIPDAIPLTEEKLHELLTTDPSHADYHFALGTVYLQTSAATDALPLLERAHALDAESVGVRYNLSAAYWLEERGDLALRILNKLILENSDFTLAHVLKGRILAEKGEITAAQGSFERAVRSDAKSVPALTELGKVHLRQQNQEEGMEYFKRAAACSDSATEARFHLARDLFKQGQVALQSRGLDAALSIWHRGFLTYPAEFTHDKELTRQMAKLVHENADAQSVNDALSLYRTSIEQKTVTERATYDLFLKLFFSLGLLPQYFVPFESLLDEQERWQKTVAEQPEYLIAHYWLGLLYSYRGELDNAVEKLLYCEDKMLPKKHQTVKLKQVAEFVRRVRNIARDKGKSYTASHEESKWTAAGFSNVFEQNAWQRSGLSPREAQAWRDAGFSPEQAKLWREQDVNPLTAALWCKENFTEPETARQWIRGDVTPAIARVWADAFKGPVSAALQCIHLGLGEPTDAAEWLSVFSLPWDAVPWKDLNFSPQEAHAWREAGYRDPYTASERRKEGFTPESARESVARVSVNVETEEEDNDESAQ